MKVNSVIVVDASSDLKLLDVSLGSPAKINALKIIHLEPDKRHKLILSSLRDFIQENKILHKDVVFSPSSESLFIKRIQLPSIPVSELPQAIKWQLKEEVLFDLATALIDFSIIKDTSREDGSRVLDVICVIAKEKEVKEEVSLLRQLGLNCLAVIPLPFGYIKLAGKKFLPEKQGEPLAILHIGDDSSFIIIQKDGKIEFYRQIPLSINKLRDSLKGALFSDKGKIELSAEEAEEVLFKVGIPEGDILYKDKFSTLQIFSMLRPILERLAQEIRRSLSYYANELGGEAVNEIFVAGLGVGILNIEKFLAKELSLAVEKISLEDKGIVSSQVNSIEWAKSYASFGLALDYNQGINLLAGELLRERVEKFQKVTLRWIIFIAFLLLFVFYLFARVGTIAYRKRLNNARIHLDVLSEVVQIKTKSDEFNKFITGIKRSQPPISDILKKLSRIIPKELFLDSISFDCDSRVVTLSGSIKTLNENHNLILDKFIDDMQDSLYFDKVNIPSVERVDGQEVVILKFHINSKLR